MVHAGETVLSALAAPLAPLRSAAIMQPTYLPWIGYFALIDRVDRFVLLDTVAFARRSWQQRNRIKTANGPLWLTLPVANKGQRGAAINDVGFSDLPQAMKSHRASLTNAYGKARYFDRYAPALFDLLSPEATRLVDITVPLILKLTELLGIDTPILRASGIGEHDDRIDRLAQLCHAVGATHYLSPPGARDYLEDGRAGFDRIGIAVDYFAYDHPVYPQLHGAFEPHLSIVDLLFNAGPDSLEILRCGVRP